MDLATLLGLIGALTAIVVSILIGGSATSFLNLPGLIIVLGGTLAVTLMKFPLAHTLGALGVATKAFVHKSERASDLIEQSVELATISRKDGLLGLEEVDVKNAFLRKGIQLVVDGHDPDLVERVLSKDIDLTIERNEEGIQIFRAIGDVAPAMGMIGTLIGLVQMMANMDDPKAIGPAMAVALLTTLYGSVIANAIALPIADKLNHRNREESTRRHLILESVRSIQKGMNPRVIEELLSTYLPSQQRFEPQEKAA
ncbi:flagellar motor component [Thioflavicoccus mobilis 8321]|uniref:Flagellar motor component n=1 Tax=Thioflavicoccus mobilis 8321 TaxID=765912 RepID=L0GV35_9GAMM|nr:flagellar motor protein PomA [Thioflavicoccus mobilis]AGA89164.1 flagellar motor component [Thioflavicoccus mobilis 8321]